MAWCSIRATELDIKAGGVVFDTTVNLFGFENVESGGISIATTINFMGKETVHPGGLSLNTTIHAGGGEIDAGVADNTDLVGGRLIVDGLGVATNTTIGHSGRMEVLNSGQAHDVTFSGGGATIEFSDPGALTGTITNWHVGDVIDLLRTRVTAVSESGDTVTVTYHNFLQRQVTYTLADQQPGTHVALRPDGHGGTDLIVTTGVQPLHQHDLFV